MCTHQGDSDFSRICGRSGCCGLVEGPPGRAQRDTGAFVECLCDPGDLPVGASWSKQCDASRTPVHTCRDRHGDARHVEEVDEIGVGAELGIRADRIGLQILDREEGRDRRHAQAIHLRQHRFRLPLERRQPVDTLERVGGRKRLSSTDDLARHRMQDIRPRLENIFQRGVAFGHPGALIEHPGNIVERREVEFDDLMAGLFENFQGCRKRAGLHLVAEEDARRRVRHADLEALLRHLQQRSRQEPGIGIRSVIAEGGRIRGKGVIDGQREDRDRVERAAGRHHAAGRKSAECRLQADNVIERGWHAAGTCRICTEREAHGAVGDNNTRAAAGASRYDFGVDGVLRRRIGRAHAHKAGRELVEIGLADHKRAGGLQLRDHECIVLGHVFEVGAGAGRRHAGDIDIVLHSEGDAPERLGRIVVAQSICCGEQVRLGRQMNEYAVIGDHIEPSQDLPDHGLRFQAPRIGLGKARQGEGQFFDCHRHASDYSRILTGLAHWMRTTQPSSDWTEWIEPSGLTTRSPVR